MQNLLFSKLNSIISSNSTVLSVGKTPNVVEFPLQFIWLALDDHKFGIFAIF